jgi:hypothetical protein
VGVATHDMPDQDIGPVTLYGKVRGLIRRAPARKRGVVGDILYASPTTAGLLTKVRPTAPNVVIVVARFYQVDATDGEILVRPTGYSHELRLRQSLTQPPTRRMAAINTATAVTLNNTLSNNGITLTSSSRLNAAQAGFYQLAAELQVASGSASAKNVYFWLRKNGSNVADSTRVVTVNINGGFTPIALNYTISLAASDYVELYWAADSTM